MKVTITKEKLDLLANVIGDKSGESLPLTIDEMVDAVDGIQTGGGGSVTITDVPNATGITCVITTSAEPEPTPTPSGIPLNTELVDITQITGDSALNSSGAVTSAQYYCVTDYIPVESGMTFDYTGCYWYYLAIYDSSKEPINVISIYNDSTVDPDNGNIGHGTLSGAELPSGSAYVRITGVFVGGSYRVSLIRTA